MRRRSRQALVHWRTMPRGSPHRLALASGLLVAGACSTSSTAPPASAPTVDSGASDGAGLDGAAGDAPAPGIDGGDASPPPDASGEAGCGEFTGDTQPTCSGDGDSLGECVNGAASVEPCPNGCLHAYGSNPASCLLASADNFSCTGSYGTTPVDDGNYYISTFGCYVDASGNVQTDPDDNCIPSCLSQALAAGLCPAGSTGPQCEESIDWYTADAARFGCLARLRVTNPATGAAVIAVALDYGPGCSGENSLDHAVLDSSGRVDDQLFGSPQGGSDKSVVHVVQVDDATPLGPVP